MIEEARHRAHQQELIYGHNTGHFTLDKEKENTFIGTLGEIVARHALLDLMVGRIPEVEVSLTNLGASVDLAVKSLPGVEGVHVKTGLWKNWPSKRFSFGVHADQNIQNTVYPLILVSLIKGTEQSPSQAQIEGFVTPSYLRDCDVITRGERFPGSGVVSQTSNIVTYIGDYLPLSSLV